jgi:uncharacterized membrane protein
MAATAKDIPPGWDYNPASWAQRLPIVGLAVIGFAMAGYLALYQYGAVARVWEPFFGEGSRVILNSRTAHFLPISDGALGALGYLGDAAAGLIGGRLRWKTMPWIIVLFGIAVGPLGGVSILLVMLQPLVYGHWCTLCLGTAFISVIMIGPAMDEVLATLQYLRRVRSARQSLWTAFWGLLPEQRL